MNPIPETWGKYRIRRKIGVGGMAEVFEAEMTGPAAFVKPVCLKRMRSELSSDPMFLKMFESEARVTALLTHANIVSVFGFEEHEGQYSLVMEYVDGLDLRQMLNAAAAAGLRLPQELAVHVLDSLLAALAYAHGLTVEGAPCPVIHRDVSPRNVLISSEGVVKLADFGLARASGISDKTRVGVVQGKVAYLSPEQVRGQVVDHTTDLFSAGLVFFETLTGSRFFQGDDEAAVLSQIQLLDPRPIPWASFALNDLISHLVTADRGRRFASAEAARNALQNLGIPSLGAPETARLVSGFRAMGIGAPDLRKPGRSTVPLHALAAERTGRLAIGAAFLAALVIGLLIAVVAWRQGRDNETPTAAAPRSAQRPLPAPAETGDVRVLADDRAQATSQTPRVGEEVLPASRGTPARPPAEKRASDPPVAALGGTLEVNVRPWANVAVDGVDRGTSPVKALALAAGSHRVTLVNQPLGYSETVRIRIKPSEVTTVNKVIE